MKREIKFRACDGKRMTTSGIMFNTSTGELVVPDSSYKLMQYTGLKDKNGVEIYEGDVINYAKKETWCKNDKCETKHKYLALEKFCPSCGNKIEPSDYVRSAEIRFLKGGFCFYEEQHKHGEHTYTAWQTFINEIYIEWVEVIGNIYQNPELINSI